jgi:hypothetical protein
MKEFFAQIFAQTAALLGNYHPGITSACTPAFVLTLFAKRIPTNKTNAFPRNGGERGIRTPDTAFDRITV